MDNKMFDTKTVFNKNYFKIGEAVKVINNKRDHDVLILEVDDIIY